MITITLDVEITLLRDDIETAVSTEYHDYKLEIPDLTLEEWKYMEDNGETQEYLVDTLWEQCRVYPFMSTVRAKETNDDTTK